MIVLTTQQLFQQQQACRNIIQQWIQDLEKEGFVYNHELSGMSQVWDHPDGRQVWLDY